MAIMCRHTMSFHVISCISYQFVLVLIMSLHSFSCHIKSYQMLSFRVQSWHLMLCHVIPCLILAHHVKTKHAVSGHFMLCDIIPCHVITWSSHVKPHHVLSCHSHCWNVSFVMSVQLIPKHLKSCPLLSSHYVNVVSFISIHMFILPNVDVQFWD